MHAKFSDFDLDFSKGKEGENLVENTLINGTIEVKNDLKWKNTGNIYVETECFYQTSGQWEPSGLSVTKADWWAFVLNGFFMLIPTEDLKLIVQVEGTAIECKIEPNPSKGYLIRIEHIENRFRFAPDKLSDRTKLNE
jgi:hypothetical protein